MKPILRFKTAGKLLEIGPWMGIFSCNAKDAGFDVTAIEMDETCVSFLRQTVGVEVYQSSDPAEKLKDIQEQFNVIALWHCLEHLPEAWKVIEAAAERLAPGGILLIAVPNVESYEFSVLKERWKHLDTPRHIYFYPQQWLISICRSNGLEMVESTTQDELSHALSEDAWSSYVVGKLKSKFIGKILGRLLLYWTIAKEKKNPSQGSGLTMVFQRPLNSQKA